jgi:NADPH-dependent 2,4-dienoyl-CoA reductase/sulfur reductase-like enzyme
VKTIAVVGASLAGLSAARGLRHHGFDGRLLIVGAEAHLPYDRPPLSKGFLAGTVAEPDLALQLDDEDLGAEWRLSAPASTLDTSIGRLTLYDGTWIDPDGVVIATGARPRRLPGRTLPGMHVLRTLDDARTLRRDLLPGARLVVVGAGFIGAEIASTARTMGVDVTVVEAAPTPLAGPLGAQMGRLLASLHTDHGVRLICGVGVTGFAGTSQVTGVVLGNGNVLPADVVVVGVGVIPNIEWLEGSGVQVDNGVRCTAAGATNIPAIVAVGDCASWYDPRHGAHRRPEHWTSARERAATAAVTLLSRGAKHGDGAAARPTRPPYFWSDQYGVTIQFAGDATGFDSVTVEAGSADERDFLAVYRCGDDAVAVLAIGQSSLFMRWRRSLAAPERPRAEVAMAQDR